MAPQTLSRSTGWLEHEDEPDPYVASVLPAVTDLRSRDVTRWQWPSGHEPRDSGFFLAAPFPADPTLSASSSFLGLASHVTVVRRSAPFPMPKLRPQKGEVVELRLVLGEIAAQDTLVEIQRSRSVEDDDSDPIEIAASVAARHPALADAEEGVRLLLSYIAEQVDRIQELSVDPRQFLDQLRNALAGRTSVLDRAMSEILQEPMLAEHEADVALGVGRANDGSLEEYRSNSWLIGLPTDRGYRYPKFQFDQGQSDVHVVVRDVNKILDAAEDPWGVVSWWFTPVARLGGRPADLVGLRDDAEIIAASKALLVPIG